MSHYRPGVYVVQVDVPEAVWELATAYLTRENRGVTPLDAEIRATVRAWMVDGAKTRGREFLAIQASRLKSKEQAARKRAGEPKA